MEFRSITGEPELDLLVSLSGKPETARRWVAGLLERGESRPSWCRMALSDGAELLAAHALDSWSPDGPPGAAPTFAHLLGHTDEAAAIALLEGDLRDFGSRTVDARLTTGHDAPPEFRALRAAQERILAGAGFTLEVDRVGLEWLAGPPVPRPAGGLSFRPASTLPDDELVEVFAAVGDGSVDHGMVTGRAERGRTAEAELRVRQARRRDHQDGWFAVGLDTEGAVVGYVQSALVDGGPAILAELGVVAPRRGRRHADELLAYGTAVLADHGAREIVSHTDVANRGMRGAFARAGYAETGHRRDYRWRVG